MCTKCARHEMKNQQITITFPKNDIRYKEELQRMKKEESINVSAFIVSAIKGELGSLWIKKQSTKFVKSETR